MSRLPPFVPYLILALICGTASVVIVFVAMMCLTHGGDRIVTDSSMYAVAAMAFAPALLGVGIAAHIANDRH